jgi:hypothetical protein
MLVELSVGAADPVRRLHAISAQVTHLKDVAQAIAGDDLMGLSGLAPALVAPALRIATKLPQHSVHTVITSRASPHPDEACLFRVDVGEKGLRSELDSDTLCHVDDRLWRWVAFVACA